MIGEGLPMETVAEDGIMYFIDFKYTKICNRSLKVAVQGLVLWPTLIHT
jgi:hypothetical protein